ncbi:hypothetical protein [Costertonia aggregata]|uniref:Uncharacterized protein n=1 Tax=Costertonia aggregata TaxID=343403 RepID=A0A7H9ANQ2_9FLAO|nr:hypothetical protein [Costertonia aggregata]QLG45066.1 hypothetical protein HYG79_06785 [Costertonia aggregata]
MKKCIALLLIIAFTAFSNLMAQHTEGGVVGFSCSFVGKPSLLVMKMSKLALKSKYDTIRQKLVKGSIGEKYLAIVLCETFVEKNEIVLTTVERKIIEDSYCSRAKLSICAGCTMFRPVTISELLNQTSAHDFGVRTRQWAKSMVQGHL